MPTIKADVDKAVRAIAGASNFTVTADNKYTISGNLNADQFEELVRTMRASRMRPSLVSGTVTFTLN